MAALVLNIDPSGAESGAKRAEDALNRVKRRAREAEAANDNLSQSYVELKSRIDPTFRAGQQFARGQAVINRELKAGAISSRQAKEATRQLEAEYRRTNATVGKLSGSVKVLAAAIPAAAVAFATRSVSAYREHNKALAEVSTLLEGTAKETAFLDDASKRLAEQFGIGATEQVRAFYQAISAGVGDAADAAKFLEEANKLAVGGVTDITKSVDLLTSVINAYERQGLRADKASDILFAGVKAGKTTIDELAATLGNVVPIASSLDVSLEEVVAGVAALTSQGQKTSVAVTGIRQALAAFLKPAAESLELSKKLGLEFDADAVKARGLAGVLDDVIRATGGNQEQMAKLFGSVEALNAVLGLVSNNGRKFKDALDATTNSAGAADEAFGKVDAELSQRLNKSLEFFKNLALESGERILTVLVPELEALVATLKKVSSEYEGLVDLLTKGDPVADLANKINEGIGSGVSALGDLISGAGELFTGSSGSNIGTGVRSPLFGGPNPQGGFPQFANTRQPLELTVTNGNVVPGATVPGSTLPTVSGLTNNTLQPRTGFNTTTENGITVIRPKSIEDELNKQGKRTDRTNSSLTDVERNTADLVNQFRDFPSSLRDINGDLLPQLLQANNNNASRIQGVLSQFLSGQQALTGTSTSGTSGSLFTSDGSFDHLGTSGSVSVTNNIRQLTVGALRQRGRDDITSRIESLQRELQGTSDPATISDLESRIANQTKLLTEYDAQTKQVLRGGVNLGSFNLGGFVRAPMTGGGIDSVRVQANVNPGEAMAFGDIAEAGLRAMTTTNNVRQGDSTTVNNINLPAQRRGPVREFDRRSITRGLAISRSLSARGG